MVARNHIFHNILMLFILVFCSCDRGSFPTQPQNTDTYVAKFPTTPYGTFVAYHRGRELFRIYAPKWRDGHRSAVSITYDAPWGINPVFSLATDAVMYRDLRMDIEIVTEKLLFSSRFPIVARIREELLPNGVGVFGHGHAHIDHDALTYHEAYQSFRTNFELMRQWGLHPKVYAYPLFAGQLRRTQAANRQAGFIAARGGTTNSFEYYLCREEPCKPGSWFNLPSVIMGTARSYDIANHDELRPILQNTLDSGAWTILTYHSIGNPEGWGFYPYDEFTQDLDFISYNDFWCGNFAEVATYIHQRNNLEINIARYFGNNTPSQFELFIGDDLNNDLYDEELTLDFDFNPEIAISAVRIIPSPNEKQTIFPINNYQLRLNMVPDEKSYTLSIIP